MPNVRDYPEPQTGGGTGAAAPGPPRRSRSPRGCGARRGGRRWTPGQTDWSETSSAPSSEPESGGTTVLSSSVHSATHDRPGGRLVAGVEPAEQVGVGVELLAGRRAGGGAERARERGEVGAVVRRGQRDRAAYVRAAAEVGDVDPDHDAARGVADQVHRRRAGLVERRVDGVARGASACSRRSWVPGAGRPHDAGVPPLGGQRVGQHLERGGRAAVPRAPAAPVPAGPGPPARRPGPGVRRRDHRGHDGDDQRQHRDAEHQPAPGGARASRTHRTSVRSGPDPSRAS